MAVARDLHELLATLSTSEKRYCRMYIKRRPGRKASNILVLYQALLGLPEYDEGALRRTLAGEAFVGHLAVVAGQLYKVILKAIRSYLTESSEVWQLRDIADWADMLRDRGLYAQSRRMTERGLALAQQLERPLVALRLLHNDWLLDGYQQYTRIREERRDERHRQAERLIGVVANQWRYLSLYEAIARRLVTIGRERTPATMRELNELSRHPFLCNEEEPLSTGAMLTRNSIREAIYYLTSNLVDSYYASRRSIQHLRSLNPKLLSTIMNLWLTNLESHISHCAQLGLLEEAWEYYGLLARTGPEAGLPGDRLYDHLYSAEGAIRWAEDNFERLIEIGLEMEGLDERYESGARRQLRTAIRNNTAFAFLVIGDSREALRWLGMVVNEPPGSVRGDLYVYARIFQLINHYELNDMELLPYLIRSLYRFLLRRNRLHRLETVLLALLRKLPDVATPGELLIVLRTARERIEETLEDAAEWQASYAGTVLPWLDSRIDGVPIAAAARRRRQQETEVARRATECLSSPYPRV